MFTVNHLSHVFAAASNIRDKISDKNMSIPTSETFFVNCAVLESRTLLLLHLGVPDTCSK